MNVNDLITPSLASEKRHLHLHGECFEQQKKRNSTEITHGLFVSHSNNFIDSQTISIFEMWQRHLHAECRCDIIRVVCDSLGISKFEFDDRNQ